MHKKISLVSTLRSLSFATLAFALAMSSGCGGIPVGDAADPPGSYSDDSSWALKIASHTPLARQEGMIIDADREEVQQEEGKATGAGIGTLAIVGSGLGAKASVLGSANAMDAILALSMLGNAGATPDAHIFARSTLAWFPADQASSAADARDKFHKMRVSALTRHLDEKGIKYKVSNISTPAILIAGPIHRMTNISTEGYAYEGCKNCNFSVLTGIPTKQTVMAPKELLGYSYPAYKFRAATTAQGGLLNRTVLSVSNDRTGEGYTTANGYEIKHWTSRDLKLMAWMSSLANPDWAVEYIPFYKPEILQSFEKGNYPPEPRYGYMVHKGEIKRFIKGH